MIKPMNMKAACITVLFLLCTSYGYAVTFDWVTVGNPGNPADTLVMRDSTTGYGSVAYTYRIATTEVTNAQYIEFLNAVAKTDTHGLYFGYMSFYGIIQNGTSGNYTYSLKDNDPSWANKPVVYVDWYDTLRFANWMHNGQPTNLQTTYQIEAATEHGAYNMTQGSSVVRLDSARYWLPDEDEWYKAAYYNPADEEYYYYPTGTDSAPDNNAPNFDSGNSANYFSLYETTDVGVYDESEGPYGTFDQGGNVFEWNETAVGTWRVRRGGSYETELETLSAYYRWYNSATTESRSVGFRIAGAYTGSPVPEPMSIGLLLCGIAGIIVWRITRA